MMAKEIQIPKKQRALVLQGGGALGAYEAGAFRAIYDHFTKEKTNLEWIGRTS
jgi:predicted acylesterase/phospholipase RssA